VLLSHDHHPDNLDHVGRALLTRADKVITTVAGAERLGGNALGLANWQSIEIPVEDGTVTITGTPCRHGPAEMDRGPVTGFILSFSNTAGPTIYISGDTVWYDGVAEVANRFRVDIAVLFMGAARVFEITKSPLTMTAEDGIGTARAVPDAKIVPLHYEGWAHFSESREVILRRSVGRNRASSSLAASRETNCRRNVMLYGWSALVGMLFEATTVCRSRRFAASARLRSSGTCSKSL
jgi:L-ascorbate metabolism protein UlaG (beta-lactamase superfamily)